MWYSRPLRMILMGMAVVILPCQIRAQVQDVKGWDRVRWGMTEQTLKSLYKGKIRKSPDPIIDKQERIYVNLEIPDYTFANAKFTVRFVMDEKSRGLTEVVLSPKETHYRMLFGILQRRMEDKYGPVTHKEGDMKEVARMGKEGFGEAQIRRFWRFPSTTIALSYWIYVMGSGEITEGLVLTFKKNAALNAPR